MLRARSFPAQRGEVAIAISVLNTMFAGRTFAQPLRRHPGKYRELLSLGRDMAGFNRLHGEKLIGLPGVRQTRTFFVMKEVVDNAPLAI